MSVNILENDYYIGAEKPFTIMHMSDIHIAYSDERDDEEIKLLAEKRKNTYPGWDTVLDEISSLSKERNALIISTGDICDFISYKNLEEVKKFTDSNNAIYTPGNHDFRLRGGMKFDTPEIKEESFSRVQELYPNSLDCFKTIINGVKFVFLDNVYYRFNRNQLEFLKDEVKDNLPIVLCMHIPLYEEGLYIKTSRNLTRHASLVCVPRNKMSFYEQKRIDQQIEDEITRKTYDYIVSEQLIKCLITGHSHKDHEGYLRTDLIQYTTGLHTARFITFR